MAVAKLALFLFQHFLEHGDFHFGDSVVLIFHDAGAPRPDDFEADAPGGLVPEQCVLVSACEPKEPLAAVDPLVEVFMANIPQALGVKWTVVFDYARGQVIRPVALSLCIERWFQFSDELFHIEIAVFGELEKRLDIQLSEVHRMGRCIRVDVLDDRGDGVELRLRNPVGFGEQHVAAEHDLFDQQVDGVPMAIRHVVLHSGDQLRRVVEVLTEHQAVDECKHARQFHVWFSLEIFDQRHRVAASRCLDDEQFGMLLGAQLLDGPVQFFQPLGAAQHAGVDGHQEALVFLHCFADAQKFTIDVEFTHVIDNGLDIEPLLSRLCKQVSKQGGFSGPEKTIEDDDWNPFHCEYDRLW